MDYHHFKSPKRDVYNLPKRGQSGDSASDFCRDAEFYDPKPPQRLALLKSEMKQKILGSSWIMNSGQFIINP